MESQHITRILGQHGVEIEDLAQLHLAIVERGRPFDDRVEGRGAFAQAQDHGVAAGLDALGDGDFALAAQQFDGAHFAQIHAHGIVGAIDRFLLLLGDELGAVIVARIIVGVVGFLALALLFMREARLLVAILDRITQTMTVARRRWRLLLDKLEA